MVMRELKKLDKVAYVRFASVYRNFEDVDEFSEADSRSFSPPTAAQSADRQLPVPCSAPPTTNSWRGAALAERGLLFTTPNPRVGCVIVKDGIVVGEGWHQRAGEAHAEVHALQAAGSARAARLPTSRSNPAVIMAARRPVAKR
jgi:hypothetical protein